MCMIEKRSKLGIAMVFNTNKLYLQAEQPGHLDILLPLRQDIDIQTSLGKWEYRVNTGYRCQNTGKSRKWIRTLAFSFSCTSSASFLSFFSSRNLNRN